MDMKYDKKICIAGKNSIAVDAMQFLCSRMPKSNLLFIPNKDDTGINGWQPSFKKFCILKDIKETTLEELQHTPNILFISLEYDRIINPNKFLSSELFNIHFSLLPKYKGMYTSALPILNGETTSGVTLHKIDHGIDTGDIISQIEFEISITDTAQDLYKKYLNNSFFLFTENINNLINETYQKKPQPPLNSSYYSKKSIDYSKISIDLNKTAFEILNQFRAFTFRNYQLPKFKEWEISKCSITEEKSSLKPAEIIKEDEYEFKISTIDYNVILKKDYYFLLYKAARDNNIQELKKAIYFVDDIDLREKNGWTALIIAAFNGNIEAVELLISAGANPSATNYKGTTVLMYAFSNYENTRDESIFKIILQAGANPNAIDDSGKDILTYMKERGCTDLINLINQ